MQSDEIRSRFLKFFEKRGHKIIPSASLVPENDPSVLFNTAGMQPLVPYLLGQKHPMGARLADSQKCVRTVDIDEVGDATHLTFFEMLGNWSLGDYWKKDSINWSFELLTSKTEGFALDPQRLYVTCFEGDENAPRDLESAEIWREIFKKNNITGERIYFRPKEKNWWSAGDNGPCGPDTEMFYDLTGKLGKGMTLAEYLKADDEQKVIEIWNNVFMEYLSEGGKIIGKLQKQNVDTGSGLERLVAVIQGKSNVFETDLFAPIIKRINKNVSSDDLKGKRIVADHIRAAVFMIADGVVPANTGRGYVLRRLLRRAKYYYSSLGARNKTLGELVYSIIPIYKKTEYGLDKKVSEINQIVTLEETKFLSTLELGKKRFEKGEDPFVLFTTYGFPIELTIELAKENEREIDIEDFNKKMANHQKLSQTSSTGIFKGGLADGGEETKKLHTATHLLRQALEDVLGEKIVQKGSNITAERLRFDFAFSRKMSDEEKKRVEETVNKKIKLKLPVQKVIMKKEEAEKTGAAHIFGDKYGDEVNIYYIGETLENAYSKEFCGGPHISNTKELSHFKILKEEAVAQGVRRIKATLI